MASMTGPPQIDPALVRAAQRGDRIARADLMDVLAPYVGQVCGPIALRDGPDAAQEALIAILKNLGRLREPGAIYGWARDRGTGGGPGGPQDRPGHPGRTRRCPRPR
jgi:RNA polymerase sigma-70 factor (ECF subfamily)